MSEKSDRSLRKASEMMKELIDSLPTGWEVAEYTHQRDGNIEVKLVVRIPS